MHHAATFWARVDFADGARAADFQPRMARFTNDTEWLHCRLLLRWTEFAAEGPALGDVPWGIPSQSYNLFASIIIPCSAIEAGSNAL